MAVDAVIANSGREREALWGLRDDVEKVHDLDPVFTFDVSLAIRDMEGYLAQVRERLASVRAVDPARTTSSAPIEVQVRYDGEDLESVATAVGLDVDEVVSLHSAAEYVVAFCGFAPGFGYLRGLDPRLQLPRRATPRTRVPAGSVAIAAEFTAVYPRPSPGGWHLLGSTDRVMFDPDRSPPALFEPGVHVRFVAS